jgi:outer membrane immunogenic protein
VRGRGGYAMNNVLLYVPAVSPMAAARSSSVRSETQTHLGWTSAAGVEVGLTPNWSAKAEYLYVRLEDRGYVLTGVNNGFSSNVFRLGVNYRF